MAGLKTPYGNGPQELDQPVPTDNLDAQMDAMVAAATPTMKAAPAQVQPSADPIDAAFAEMDASMAPPPQQGSFNAPLTVPGAEPQATFKERAFMKLGANETEWLNAAKSLYGKENAWKDGDAIYFRREKGGKPVKLTSAQLSSIKDLLADQSRNIVKELGMLPGEAAGGAAGFLFPAPGATAAGGLIGRVASVPFSNNLADHVAMWAGIEQDPTRNKEMENNIDQIIESALPVVSSIGKGVGKKLISKIPGSKGAIEAEATALARDGFHMSDDSLDIMKDIQRLREKGFNMEILNNQLHTTSTPLKTAANKVAAHPEFQNAQTRVAQNVSDVVQRVYAKIWDPKLAGKAKPGRIGEQVKGAAQQVLADEGAEIGKYKAKAMANTKNGKVPLTPEIEQRLHNLGQAFGFDINKGTRPKDLRSLAGQMGVSQQDVPAFVNNLAELIKKTEKGTGLRYSDLDAAIKNVTSMLPTASKYADAPINKEWRALAKDLRKFKNQAIEDGLTDPAMKKILARYPEQAGALSADVKAFRKINGEYGAVLDSVENIESIISDDMGSHIVIDKLLNKGKEGLGDAQALRFILQKKNPELWEKLKGEWVARQFELAQSRGERVNINPTKLLNDVEKYYGDEFMDVMFKGTKGELPELKASLRVAEQIKRMTIEPGQAVTDDMGMKVVDAASKGFFGSAYMKARGFLNAIGVTSRETAERNALMAVLTQKGADRYIKGLPEGKRNAASQFFEDVEMWATKQGFINSTVRNTVKGTGQAVKRGTRQTMRSHYDQVGSGAAEDINDYVETQE